MFQEFKYGCLRIPVSPYFQRPIASIVYQSTYQTVIDLPRHPYKEMPVFGSIVILQSRVPWLTLNNSQTFSSYTFLTESTLLFIGRIPDRPISGEELVQCLHWIMLTPLFGSRVCPRYRRSKVLFICQLIAVHTKMASTELCNVGWNHSLPLQCQQGLTVYT